MKRFLKWKWLLRFDVLMVLLSCILPLSVVLVVRYQGNTELQKIITQLDADDPNWKLDELATELNAKLPPPDRNPYTVFQKAHAALPSGWNQLTNAPPELDKTPVNCVPSKPVLDDFIKLQQSTLPALQHARQLAGMPEGGRVLQFPRNPMMFDMAVIQQFRDIAAVLRNDAIALASVGRSKEAIQSARAAFGVPRAIGSDPTMISQLVRMATDAIAVSTVERILNLGEPTEGLSELQADLLQQSMFPYIRHSMRGERAFVHRMYEITDSGENTSTPGGKAGAGLPTTGNSVTVWGLRINLPTDHAYSLKMLTQYVEASKLPPEQQLEAVKAIVRPQKNDARYTMTSNLVPALDKGLEAGLRTKGKLVATAVGVACERYRQKFGQWPLTLDMIPKDILSEIPNDPYTGKPITYKRLPDGIKVYTIGPDMKDDGGLLDNETPGTVGKDYGIRIYDPALRRQPAPPKPVEGAEPEKP